ncbi:FxLYD domain-containing protein [Bordetella hinzii]|uniref:FxLYD domain-containing protein n=1 Tax=Bordetella hinzii TaxID=103855 RepID=UPI001151EF33|nr:FxLYD domain-containing protein [Bordetella hinzii]QDJ31901.1 hypothetical protein CBR68_06040 [Bordetella hinzii]
MNLFKHVFAAVLLCLSVQAMAQSLPYGVTLGNLQATRDNIAGQTVITGTYSNQGQKRIVQPSVTFALFDANGQEIGRISSQSPIPLEPGDLWHIRASTPMTFQRFTAVEVRAD